MIVGVLLGARRVTIDAMILEIERTMSEIKKDAQRFKMTDKKLCEKCGCENSFAAETCDSCNSTEFLYYYCDSGYRLAFFVTFLEASHVWPLSSQKGNSPASLLEAITGHVPCNNGCSENYKCPGIITSFTLIGKLERVMKEASTIDFKPARFERDLWTQATNAGVKRKAEETSTSDTYHRRRTCVDH